MRFTQDYVFFWSGPFSQWHRSTFKIKGIEYDCAEQYMMHQKAVLFGDEYHARKILEAADPNTQKGLGRLVEGFDEEIWNKHARPIVYRGSLGKYTQNYKLYAELMDTGKRTLVEASPYDKIWGIGMKEDDEGVTDPANWKGKNWLGQVLTKLRDELAKDSDKAPF